MLDTNLQQLIPDCLFLDPPIPTLTPSTTHSPHIAVKHLMIQKENETKSAIKTQKKRNVAQTRRKTQRQNFKVHCHLPIT
jgi:hypothetical protein